MNRKLTFTLLLLHSLLTYGQTTVPRRGMFSVLGMYGVNNTLSQPQVKVISGQYSLIPEKVEDPECYDSNGNLVACNGKNNHYALGLLYRLSNRSRTAGWMLYVNASIQAQTFTLNYPSNRNFYIPVACTPSIRRHLRSTGVSASVGRYWNVERTSTMQLFVRVGAIRTQRFRYLRGTNSVSLPDRSEIRYIDNGSGTIIKMSDNVPPYNWLITPEIGITAEQFPLELSLSIHLPIINPIIFSELHTFVSNNRIVGENRVSYSNAVFNLTARLGFNLLGSTKRARAPRRTSPTTRSSPPAPKPAPNPPPVQQSAPESGKFAGRSLNNPINLSIYFELTKANLLPQSNAELDEVVQWMRQNPNVSIRLEGHTDKIGDADKNLQLSRERVNAVREYLMVKGISGMRIEVKGYGDTRLVCPSPCERNRRVEMVITKR